MYTIVTKIKSKQVIGELALNYELSKLAAKGIRVLKVVGRND